jgi:hypothetical protein
MGAAVTILNNDDGRRGGIGVSVWERRDAIHMLRGPLFVLGRDRGGVSGLEHGLLA